MGLCRCDKWRILKRKDNPVLSGGPNVITGFLRKGAGVREGDMRTEIGIVVQEGDLKML